MKATTWSFSLAPYVFGMSFSGLSPRPTNPREVSHADGGDLGLTAITPATQCLGAGQVVVRAGSADGQQADTEVGQRLGLGDQPARIRGSGLAAHRARPF